MTYKIYYSMSQVAVSVTILPFSSNTCQLHVNEVHLKSIKGEKTRFIHWHSYDKIIPWYCRCWHGKETITDTYKIFKRSTIINPCLDIPIIYNLSKLYINLIYLFTLFLSNKYIISIPNMLCMGVHYVVNIVQFAMK